MDVASLSKRAGNTEALKTAGIPAPLEPIMILTSFYQQRVSWTSEAITPNPSTAV
jgi:hypothetical protein